MSGEGRYSLAQILDEVEEQGATETAAQGTEEASSSATAESALSALLASPQLLQAVGGISSLLSSAQTPKGEEKTAGSDTPNARALLCALRPYLGEHRRTTIDSMLQLLQLKTLLQSLPLQQHLSKVQK